jgi:RNA polymerase sigma factor (sigma-70 family)
MQPTREQLLNWLESKGVVERIARFARRLSKEPDDLIQEALFRALKGAARQAKRAEQAVFKDGAARQAERGEQFAPQLVARWFFLVMRHTAIDEVRRGGRRRQTVSAADIENLEEVYSEPVERAMDLPLPQAGDDFTFTQALEGLTVAEKKVIALVYYEGLKTAEAARELRVTPTAVRNTQARALRKLQRALRAPIRGPKR